MAKQYKEYRTGGFQKSAQQLFIKEFFNNGFNISKACEKVDIDRGTYYKLLNSSPEFRAQIDLISEIFGDIIKNTIISGLTDPKATHSEKTKYLTSLPPKFLDKIFKVDSNEDIDGTFKLNKDNFTK